MDPLSITTGVLAIATAAAQISKALSHLRAFGEVPRQLYALKNEVSDLEVVLRQIDYASKQSTLVQDADTEPLDRLLDRAKMHLADLATRLERLASAAIKKSLIWLKEENAFKRLQVDIHTVKTSLSLVLGVANSQDLHHIILELRQVTFLTASSRHLQQRSSDELVHTLNTHQNVINARMDQKFDELNARLDAFGRYALGESNPVLSPTGDGEAEQPPSKIESLRVVINQHAPCQNWCPCQCHAKQRRTKTVPGIMESLLGTMFVGYSGLPVLNKPCDFRGCRHQQHASASIEYWFPWWLVSKNIKIQFKYLPNVGPQLQLATLRRVPDTALSVAYARQGNIDGLRFLFHDGLASPRDISDSRGFSLIRWALYGGMHQYETVKFLLSQGAQVDDEACAYSLPRSYDNVWDFTIRGKCTPVQQHELRCITQSASSSTDRDDWVTEQNFPLIHRIILGISSKPLADEIAENPTAVYLKDAQGRTALDWATARAQLSDMRLLIANGADPNSMDITGRTTVLHAVDSHVDEALQIVLEEGHADPNPKMPPGIFRSSPLTSSGFGGLTNMLRLLLKHGAEIDACNPEGMTALHSVASTQNVESALVLLEWGADLNAVSRNGRTPLTTAIVYNNHPVLRLFIERCYEFIITARFKGPQLLPVIAEYADLETLSILSSSYPFKLSLDLGQESLDNCRRILEARRDFDEKLKAAFEELVWIAKAEEEAIAGVAGSDVDSLAESGLYFSAKSSFHSDIAEAIAALRSARQSPEEGSQGEEDDEEDQAFVSPPYSPVEGERMAEVKGKLGVRVSGFEQ
ncbi:ankyrin [Rhypophila decipiens]